MNNKLIWPLAIVLACLSIQLSAQTERVITDSLYSNILSEQRRISIVFPKDYKPGSDTDNEFLFCLDDVSGYQIVEWDFLQGEGFIPKNMIIIGITNPKPNGNDMRERDFSPTKKWGNTGGASNFLEFIRSELMPYVKKKYNGSDDGHTLYGGSLGGLFVIYNLLKAPELFTSYVAVDPSLWWDNQVVKTIADSTSDDNRFQNKTVFIAGRKGNAYREMGIGALDTTWQKKQLNGLRKKFSLYDNETHYSTNFQGFWEGLKFSYGGFYASTGGYFTSRKVAIKPKTGIIIPGEPFRFTCYNLSAGDYIHYTIDGSMPTLSSQKLDGEETLITLNKTSKVIAGSFGARSKFNKTDSAFFQAGKSFEAVQPKQTLTSGGLKFKVYEGKWESLPDLNKITPVKTGTTLKDFELNQITTGKDKISVLEGFIKIDKKGYYILEMGGGNQSSKVFVDNYQMLGNNFIIDEGEMFLTPLEAGFHTFKIIYFRKQGSPELAPIYIKPDGVEDFEIPASMLYH